MMHEYIQSTEQYKGFTLEVEMCRLHDYGSYHRRCRVYKDGKGIATGKSKKAMKELIDSGCFEMLRIV